jgi:hypothetical protein
MLLAGRQPAVMCISAAGLPSFNHPARVPVMNSS